MAYTNPTLTIFGDKRVMAGIAVVTSTQAVVCPFNVEGAVVSLWSDASATVDMCSVTTFTGKTFTIKCWTVLHANTTTPTAATGTVSYFAWGSD